MNQKHFPVLHLLDIMNTSLSRRSKYLANVTSASKLSSLEYISQTLGFEPRPDTCIRILIICVLWQPVQRCVTVQLCTAPYRCCQWSSLCLNFLLSITGLSPPGQSSSCHAPLPCLVLTLEPHCQCVLSATGTWPGCSLCLECSLQALLILLHLGQFLLCRRCQPTSSRPLLSELKPTVLWPENVGYISLCELLYKVHPEAECLCGTHDTQMFILLLAIYLF